MLDLQNLNYNNIFVFIQTVDLGSLEKNELKALKAKLFEFQVFWDIKNQLYKVNVINSLYGILGEKHSPIHNPLNAEATTAGGQFGIRGVSHALEHELADELRVFYNDTDSVFITVDDLPVDIPSKEFAERAQKYADDKLVPVIDKFFDKVAKFTNTENKMVMDVESFCDQVIMHTPKKYIARLIVHKGMFYDKSDYKFKIKGLELVRGDTPKWVRDKIYDSLHIMFDGTNDELITYIEKAKEEFKKLPLLEMAKPMGIKDMSAYEPFEDGTFKKGTPRQHKSAHTYNKYLEDNKLDMEFQRIYSGGKIGQIWFTPEGAVKMGLDSIAININDKIPPKLLEAMDGIIDYDMMWGKAFVPPVKRLMDDIGWSFERHNDYFDTL